MENIFQAFDSTVADTSGIMNSASDIFTFHEPKNPASDSLIVLSDTSDQHKDTMNHQPPPTLFKEHLLQTGLRIEEPLPAANEDWIAIHLIGVLFILAWIRSGFAKRFRQVFSSFANQRYQGMLSKEGNLLREQISLGLLVVYLIVTSVFFYVLTTRLIITNEFDLRGFQLFSLILIGVLAYWVLKNILITFIGHIFKNPVLLREFILTNFIFNVVLSIGLIPFLFLIVYVPSVMILYIGILLFAAGHFYRIIRELFTALSYAKFSYLNRILYLCTFEIVPIVVLTKLIINKLV